MELAVIADLKLAINDAARILEKNAAVLHLEEARFNAAVLLDGKRVAAVMVERQFRVRGFLSLRKEDARPVSFKPRVLVRGLSGARSKTDGKKSGEKDFGERHGRCIGGNGE